MFSWSKVLVNGLFHKFETPYVMAFSSSTNGQLLVQHRYDLSDFDYWNYFTINVFFLASKIRLQIRKHPVYFSVLWRQTWHEYISVNLELPQPIAWLLVNIIRFLRYVRWKECGFFFAVIILINLFIFPKTQPSNLRK